MPFEVQLDKTRTLKFTNGALIEFEKITGMDIISLMSSPDKLITFTNSTTLVYVGLLGEADPLSLKEVTELMPVNITKRMQIIEVISNAMSDAFGVDEGEKTTKKKVSGNGMKPANSTSNCSHWSKACLLRRTRFRSKLQCRWQGWTAVNCVCRCRKLAVKIGWGWRSCSKSMG